MVWKQDLAKLKKDMRAEEGPAPKAPPPKPIPKPLESRPIEDEDAMFLAAMGGKPAAAPRPSKPKVEEAPMPQPEAPAPAPPENFQDAMDGLKGMKRMGTAPVIQRAEAPKPAPPPPPEPPVVHEPEVTVLEPVESPAKPAPSIPTGHQGPQLIHLAAGMAVEVDGSLDLRGHSPEDALERLRERILDGLHLGWRTLHVNLGPSPQGRDAFLGYLGSSEARAISRYAQAPIPMGGSQAWIVYFSAQPSASKPEIP